MSDHDLRVLMGARAYNLARSAGETRTARHIYKVLMLAHAWGASYETSLSVGGFL